MEKWQSKTRNVINADFWTSSGPEAVEWPSVTYNERARGAGIRAVRKLPFKTSQAADSAGGNLRSRG